MRYQTTTHTMTAIITHSFVPASLEEIEVANVEMEITFTFLPGMPEQGPSYASGGEPADPDEIELVSAKLVDGDGIDPTQAQIDDWAEDWLNDAGYDEARMAAIEDLIARMED